MGLILVAYHIKLYWIIIYNLCAMKRYLPQKTLHELLSWTIKAEIIMFCITSETMVIIAVEIVIKLNNYFKIILRIQNVNSCVSIEVKSWTKYEWINDSA
jgi:hypothetical protein